MHLGRYALLMTVVVSGSARADEVEDPSAEEFVGGGYNETRIEQELKLRVPDELPSDEVWKYLTTRYDNANSYLHEIRPGFTATFSDEYFRDAYHDTPDFTLLKWESGIRVRGRINANNPGDRKSGRELVQIKLKRPGDKEVNRSEIKYPVEELSKMDTPLDMHPLLGLIGEKHRADFMARTKELGIDATQLSEVLVNLQRRRRVYVALEGKSFATITLDDVTSEKLGKKVAFTEVEMELNEIGYTNATPERREMMEAVNEKMRADLLGKFPGIVQDQTPKYNKIFKRFEAQIPFFAVLVFNFQNVVGAVLVGFLVIVAAVVLLLKRRAAKKNGSGTGVVSFRAPQAPAQP